jgi:hypothetical protein
VKWATPDALGVTYDKVGDARRAWGDVRRGQRRPMRSEWRAARLATPGVLGVTWGEVGNPWIVRGEKRQVGAAPVSRGDEQQGRGHPVRPE